MLKAIIDADILRETIEAIAALVSECRLHIENDGFSMLAVDTANVAMVKAVLQKTAFQSYEAESCEIGVDITKLRNILGTPGKTDQVKIELDETRHKLELSFMGYKYSVALLDTNTIRKEPNEPNIELPAKIIVPGMELNNAIKASMLISDKIALGVDTQEKNGPFFFMHADGDTDQINKTFGPTEVQFVNPVDSRSLFSIDYLKDMGKIFGKSASVEVHLGTDHPVKFIFDMSNGNAHFIYLLAPRIEAD